MKEKLFAEYSDYLASDKHVFAKTQKRIQLLALLRLIAFLVFILSVIFFKTLGSYLAFSIIGISTVLFFYWIKRFLFHEKKKQLFVNLIQINEDELKAVGEDYSPFDGGHEFVDPDHQFSFDLDIFGEGSIFQFINRTVTEAGKNKLAFLLKNPETEANKIRLKQEALLELSQQVRWRQKYAATGKTEDKNGLQFLGKGSAYPKLNNTRAIFRLILIFPALFVAVLVLCSLSILPWSSMVFPFVANAVVLMSYQKTILSFYSRFGNRAKNLDKTLQLLISVENKDFNSLLLRELQQKLYHNKKKASQVIKELKNIMGIFDNRSNLLFILTGELIFLADLICIYKLNKWAKDYQKDVEGWFEVIAEFDALASFANSNHNQPAWVLPEVCEQEPRYVAEGLGHPLIKSEKRIGNSFQLEGDSQLAIITGANMAGKSTFLRALGVNIVLAQNGCKVCADKMSIKPVEVFSNMRTSDNLQKDKSYFFAELERLQSMLVKLRNGHQLFILVDEMLKGTNSIDKLMGSKELVKQLISINAFGVVATHDLALTELSKEYPSQIHNQCFDVRLFENELVFDYKLTDGVTSTMNASFLMRKMGIIPEKE